MALAKQSGFGMALDDLLQIALTVILLFLMTTIRQNGGLPKDDCSSGGTPWLSFDHGYYRSPASRASTVSCRAFEHLSAAHECFDHNQRKLLRGRAIGF
jgi:hypothetical protein